MAVCPSSDTCRSIILPGFLAIGKSIVPDFSFKIPSATAIYSFLIFVLFIISSCMYSFLANRTIPDVSLSNLFMGLIFLLLFK